MYYSEYIDWQSFYLVEPWGCEIEDDRITKLFNAALMGTVNDHKWVEIGTLFPRSNGDIQARKKHDQDLELKTKITAFFRQHNRKLEARENDLNK